MIKANTARTFNINDTSLTVKGNELRILFDKFAENPLSFCIADLKGELEARNYSLTRTADFMTLVLRKTAREKWGSLVAAPQANRSGAQTASYTGLPPVEQKLAVIRNFLAEDSSRSASRDGNFQMPLKSARPPLEVVKSKSTQLDRKPKDSKTTDYGKNYGVKVGKQLREKVLGRATTAKANNRTKTTDNFEAS